MRIDFFEHLLYAKSEKEERAEIDSFADQIHFGCNSAVGFMYGWVKAISLRSELMLLYRKPPRKSTANEQKEKDVIISLQIPG